MPIIAEITIPADSEQVVFAPTMVNWDRQELTFHYISPTLGKKSYVHRLLVGQWNYLVGGLETIMTTIPAVGNIVIPPYDPNLWDPPAVE